MNIRVEVSMVLVVAFIVALTVLPDREARLPVPAVLRLQRTVHLKGVSMKQLNQWDMIQHAKRGLFSMGQNTNGVVQLPVLGSIDIFVGCYCPMITRPYLTQLKLGKPPRNFTFMIDTGSDTLWVACKPCSGCSKTRGLRESYDPNLSSSSTVIACTDDWCRTATRSGFASCDSSYNQTGHCGYHIFYVSGETSGYYVSDQIRFDTFGGSATSFSTSVIFDCSSFQSGGLMDPDLAFDGILGIGPAQVSMNSQLNSIGIAPSVFSICLTTKDSGSGILVLGEAVDQGLIYTPLVPSKILYKLHLESIAVNGQKLQIDSSVFETSHNRGTILDSGTTLAYLAEQAYDPFVQAIAAAVSPSVSPVNNNGEQCFLTSSGMIDASSFPSATLHFKGGAVMTVKPQNYLLPEVIYLANPKAYSSTIVNLLCPFQNGDPSMFCLGWKRKQGKLSVLGDIVIMDKLIVHDLDNMRLGWMDYDCSQSVNINTSRPWKKRRDNSGHVLYTLSIPSAVAVILTHMLVFAF